MNSLRHIGIALLLLCICLLINTQELAAQEKLDTTETWHVITAGGNEFHGQIIERTEESIRLKTTSFGTVTILLSNIKKIQPVEESKIVGDEVWMDNPQETRYFWGPSGYGLKKGESYYQNTWIFFNQYATGVTDNFSIGVGTVPLFLFGGSSTPVWITPKVSLGTKDENMAFAVGGLFGTVLGEGESFGIVYGVSTFGSRDKNASIGIGYGFSNEGFADVPTISFSGMIRTGKRGYLLTENYIIDVGIGDRNVIIGLGGRTVWTNISLDYGFFMPATTEDFGLLPWLGVVIPVSNKKSNGVKQF